MAMFFDVLQNFFHFSSLAGLCLFCGVTYNEFIIAHWPPSLPPIFVSFIQFFFDGRMNDCKD